MIVLSWSLVVLAAGLLTVGLTASQPVWLIAASVVAVLAFVPMVVAVRSARARDQRPRSHGPTTDPGDRSDG